jgi:hypothetical protein
MWNAESHWIVTALTLRRITVWPRRSQARACHRAAGGPSPQRLLQVFDKILGVLQADG